MNPADRYPALSHTNQPAVGTAQAAFYLGREPQTLRHWASRGEGPIKPLNVHGRLAWPVAKLREVLGVAA